MRILVDTNVLLDYLAKRDPFFTTSHKLLMACMQQRFEGYIAAHSILNMSYILRHD